MVAGPTARSAYHRAVLGITSHFGAPDDHLLGVGENVNVHVPVLRRCQRTNLRRLAILPNRTS